MNKNANEVCIPTSALAVAGTPPAAGDDVEVTLKGKVTRTDGDNTCFTPTEANGQPIDAEDAEDGGDDEEAEGEPTEQSLRDAADEHDQASGTA